MTASTDLTPSPARTALLQSCLLPIQVVQMEPKASADCLDYSLDFTNVLQCTGDTPSAINSITVQTAQQETYDLTVMWSGVSGSMAMMLLASGQPGTVQRLLVEVATNQGRILSVAVLIRITDLTDATPPPSDFPADVTTNGKVLIAGESALPTGYSSNGRVVMLTTQDAPVGTPDFESVTAGTYAGDGSGLNVTAASKTQTVAEWIASLASGGAQGVGIVKIEATQGPVTAGQSSVITLTATLTNGSTSETTFTSPAGADGATGATGDTGPAGADGATGATGSAGADGASAYQVAVANGYTGTQAEWLASLKGATGDTGATGATGQAGAQGVGVKEITLTQDPVTAGEQSTVTMATTLSDGTETTSQTFEVPAGAPGATGATGATGPAGAAGSDATVTAANIETALGYAPAAAAVQYKAADLPTSATVGNSVFCTDATSGLQGQTFPAEGCYLFWNGAAWVDYMGFAYTTGNFPGGTAHISAQKISASYELDVASGYVYGFFAFQNNAVLDMQNQTTITSSTGNTLATVKANTDTTQNAVSALAWAKDARGPSEAAGAGTGRWVYKNTAGTWCDFATGTEALV